MELALAGPARMRVFGRLLAVLVGSAALAVLPAAAASAQLPTTDDPRVGLAPGLENAGTASLGMQHLANRPKPAGFIPPGRQPGQLRVPELRHGVPGRLRVRRRLQRLPRSTNISNPAAPTLTTAVVCPGGQGDLSVYRNLLFMSVEETRAKKDCTLTPAADADDALPRRAHLRHQQHRRAGAGRRRADLPRLAHAHAGRPQGRSPTTSTSTSQGTVGHDRPDRRPDDAATPARRRTRTRRSGGSRSSRSRSPRPQNAAIVNEPRLFRDETTGARQRPPERAARRRCIRPGIGWGPTPDTNSCHDITVYEELDIAAGACEGNGLLIDISDPANPKRIDAVADPLYAYWHGATFSNDGKNVIFTDEWGGGTAARCRATDQLSWGGDSIYEIVNRKLVFRSYYKLPVAQTDQENCVSHIPSIVPVPGRDIFVQAWYQGGASLVDFTDPSQPERDRLLRPRPDQRDARWSLGGFWSTYWYNGEWYGSELARNFDVVGLTSDHAALGRTRSPRPVRSRSAA